ncbi:hypothetical protein NONI108955_21095 [Nocardia ninae]|uniref:Uncharacterized protein n=1 Tax=Nocardia ninae NBRC 108245 TaxID=1210091 RepID=A0A511MAC0_9NOCA|nr:hypothetical protein [Nocardia ninae]GEM37451.1 hypothetical protein NN4_19700 [Nocardia ninae NBRC 108245]
MTDLQKRLAALYAVTYQLGEVCPLADIWLIVVDHELSASPEPSAADLADVQGQIRETMRELAKPIFAELETLLTR